MSSSEMQQTLISEKYIFDKNKKLGNFVSNQNIHDSSLKMINLLNVEDSNLLIVSWVTLARLNLLK